MAIPQVEMMLRRLGMARGVGPARLKPRLPATAVQVAPGRVAAVRLVLPASGNKGAHPGPRLAAFQEAELPEASVSPSLTRPNIADPAPVGGAVSAVLARVAPKEPRVSVVLPDSAARVAILKFNRLPATRQEVLDLVRFRLQKVLPFRIEEAAIDYQLLSNGSAVEPEFLVALIQRPILWQYERIFTAQDRMPGLVDLDTFNVANLAGRSGDGAPAGDHALVNAAEGYLTVLFFRNGVMNFSRSKSFAVEERATPQHLHASIRRELASCAAYYREHLTGAGLEVATLRVVEGDPPVVLETAREELACPVKLLDPGRAVRLPDGADPADPLWQRLAPALGAALGRSS